MSSQSVSLSPLMFVTEVWIPNFRQVVQLYIDLSNITKNFNLLISVQKIGTRFKISTFAFIKQSATLFQTLSKASKFQMCTRVLSSMKFDRSL